MKAYRVHDDGSWQEIGDGEQVGLAVLLSSTDRSNIARMVPGARLYCMFPDTFNRAAVKDALANILDGAPGSFTAVTGSVAGRWRVEPGSPQSRAPGILTTESGRCSNGMVGVFIEVPTDAPLDEVAVDLRARIVDAVNWHESAHPGTVLSLALASKLASIAVHADELLGPGGHDFDRTALLQAIGDPEVKAWLASLGPLAPVKRVPS